MVEDYVVSIQMVRFLVPESDLYKWHLARLEWFDEQIMGMIGSDGENTIGE